MSDEELNRAKAAAQQLWNRMVDSFDAARQLLRTVIEFLKRSFKSVWLFVCRWRQVIARYEWADARRTARFLNRHPDVSVLDGWLDRWYIDPALSA